LWTAPNSVVVPHVSGMGDLTALWHSTALLLAEQLRRELAGEPLLNVTSGSAGY
jgi:phosphoglycerate dehydrogenase-like enzyme